eukprot:3745397-Rhodomonas_salina.2
MLLPGRERERAEKDADSRYVSPISLRAPYAVSGTGLAYAATRFLCDFRYWPSVCCYRTIYAMSGTESGSRALSGEEKRGARRSSEAGRNPYLPTRLLCDARYCCSVSSYGCAMRCPVLTYCIFLHTCYAMPGTDLRVQIERDSRERKEEGGGRKLEGGGRREEGGGRKERRGRGVLCSYEL